MRKWRPDGNQRDPGAWYSGSDMLPTSVGSYRTIPQWAGYGTAAAGPATPGTTGAFWALQPLGLGTPAIGIVGTSTKLYEVSSSTTLLSGTFTDRSGAVYTSVNWVCTMYGNVVIATNLQDAPQANTYPISGNFAALAGSPPKARYVITQSNAVLLFDYNDGVNSYSDGWWASDIGDHTTWTPAASNDAANGRILSRPGNITAAVAFRDEVIVFKQTSMHRMRYVGAPVYWTVELLADGIGAASPTRVCNCGDFLLFIGEQGAYRFDGSSLQKISVGFEDSGAGSALIGTSAADNPGIGFWYPRTGDAVFDSRNTMVYNVIADAWGLNNNYMSYNVAGSVDFYSGYMVMNGTPDARNSLGGQSYGRFNGQGATAFGSIAVNLSANPCVIANTSQVVSTDYPVMRLATEYIGDERWMTNVTRVIPVFTHSQDMNLTMGANARYTLNVYTYNLPHGLPVGYFALTPTLTVTSSTTQFRFDMNITARFLRFEFIANAPCEILDLIVMAKQQGEQ